MYYVYASKNLSYDLPFFCWVITATKEKKAVVATHSRVELIGVGNDQQLEYLGIFHSYISIYEWNLIHKEDLSVCLTQSKITNYFKKKPLSFDLKSEKEILNFFAESDQIISHKLNFFEGTIGSYKKITFM